MKTRESVSPAITYIILIVAAVISIFPFLWMVSTSFKGLSEVFAMPPTLIPKSPTCQNYLQGWGYSDFTTFTKNSIFVTLICTIGTVLSSAVVAFGFSRYKARLSGLLITVMLGTMMLPAQVTLIPQYMLYNKLGMIDTFWPLFIPAWLGGGAFNIFLFMQFFKSLPKELDEAASIDGANSFQLFIRVMLPAVKPVIIAVGVMSLVYNWNDFFTPLIYLNSQPNYTIAIGLQFFKSSYGNMQVGMMMAVSVITLLPVLLLFFICQKYFVQGIKMSGLKA
ncbi:MAG TPA: sugar ABC transporter permease [Firmicutes bacterium]|nr:sugar ABC transporter permease [Bacillota bacterium]